MSLSFQSKRIQKFEEGYFYQYEIKGLGFIFFDWDVSLNQNKIFEMKDANMCALRDKYNPSHTFKVIIEKKYKEKNGEITHVDVLYSSIEH